MDNEKKEIRFIDSKYRELFRIQDGDSIEISYPDNVLLLMNTIRRLDFRYFISVNLQKKWKQPGQFTGRQKD